MPSLPSWCLVYYGWCEFNGRIFWRWQRTKSDLQQMWTCDHYIGAILVFCPDGIISICWYNALGAMHDIVIASIEKIYNKLKDVYRTEAWCTVHSASACNNYPFLIKLCKPSIDWRDGYCKGCNRYLTIIRMGHEGIPCFSPANQRLYCTWVQRSVLTHDETHNSTLQLLHYEYQNQSYFKCIHAIFLCQSNFTPLL